MRPYNEYESEQELINEITVCTDIKTTLLLIDEYVNLCEWYWQSFFIKCEVGNDMYEYYYGLSNTISELLEQIQPDNRQLIINQIKEIINEISE